MVDPTKFLYLYNPLSGGGRGKALWLAAKKRYQIPDEQAKDITKVKDLAVLVAEAGVDVVVAAGGDGTINAVSQAVVECKKRPLIAVLPFGFGNALSYCFGVETMDKAFDVLQRRANAVTIDLLQTNIAGNRIGVFSVSLGYEARVVHNRAHYQYIGPHSYTVAAVKSLVEHKDRPIDVTIDRQVKLRANSSCLLISNSPTIGKNFIVAPNAKLNDLKMDCTIFSSKFAYLTNLRFRGYVHPFYSDKGKVQFQATELFIEGEPFVQIDGDPVKHTGGVHIKVLPKAVTFLCNDKKHIRQEYLAFLG